jgi:myo-inositol 2-dehydrogenase/D-chiro-inositol 1-dehydrogenase
VRAALIGFGRMGATLAEAIVQHVPALSVVAVAEPDAIAVRRARQLFGNDVTIYADAAAALEHPGLSLALVASPTPTHPTVVECALTRGLHVFCEKPLSFDPDVSDRLGSQATESGLVLQIGFFRRYSTPWVTAREILMEGSIGEPVFVRSSTWDKDLPVPAFANPAVSGGLVIDDGVHEFDVVQWLTGRPIKRVACVVAPVAHPEVREAGDIDCAAMLLELEGGVPAVVDLSRNARYADDMRTEILTADGAVFIDTVPGGHVRIGSRSGRDILTDSLVEDGFLDGVARELGAFVMTVDGGSMEFPDAFASSQAVRVALAANRAAATGRWIALHEVSGLDPSEAFAL